MRILFCGDIVGRSGREVVLTNVPKIIASKKIDFVIANAENAAHGFGINKAICKSLYEVGVDVLTTGNHVWDQREVLFFIDQDERLIRPINYPQSSPGRGFTVVQSRGGKKVLVINAMARLYMDPLDDPFAAVEKILQNYKLAQQVDAIVLDFHGEATAEKVAMGHICDGRVSLVVGTHTHIPTADHMILPNGTGYQSDAGMCGDYNSVIGMDKDVPIAKFTKKLPTERMQPATGPGTLCGLIIETNKAGLCQTIEPVRIGPNLSETG
jgi:metallophosphoesterase (TIGR00282 family)